MIHYDSTGKVVTEGDTVRFRGEVYTIKRFLETTGACGTSQIKFEEEQHVSEIADEISIDLISQNENIVIENMDVTKQMRTVLRCQTPSELSGVLKPNMIRDAINELEIKGVLVKNGMDEYTALDKLAYEVLKQSAGIK